MNWFNYRCITHLLNGTRILRIDTNTNSRFVKIRKIRVPFNFGIKVEILTRIMKIFIFLVQICARLVNYHPKLKKTPNETIS
jgi:hypothetical protein